MASANSIIKCIQILYDSSIITNKVLSCKLLGKHGYSSLSIEVLTVYYEMTQNITYSEPYILLQLSTSTFAPAGSLIVPTCEDSNDVYEKRPFIVLPQSPATWIQPYNKLSMSMDGDSLHLNIDLLGTDRRSIWPILSRVVLLLSIEYSV